MRFLPVDRWSVLLDWDKQNAKDRGALPEPVAPVIPPNVSLPVLVHFTAGTQLLGTNFDYGDTLEITAEMVPALADVNGRVAIFELLHDPAAQRARWGSWRVRPGPWPAGTSKVAPGSARWEAARSDYYRWSRSLPFESERERALIEAKKRFGDSEFGPCAPQIIARAYGFEPE